MEALTLWCLLALASPAAEPGFAASDNFIVNAPSQELADAVLSRAEVLRDRLSMQWLGQPLPPRDGRTIVHVRINDERDRASTLPRSRDSRRNCHMIWLETSAEMALGATLAHEMTHAVLATVYGEDLPPWANEGAAGLQDDPRTCEFRRRQLQQYAASGRWPGLLETLDARNLAASDAEGYTVACSLSEFLLTRGDARTFLEFAVNGGRVGWDRAVRASYGFASVGELRDAWRTWATRDAQRWVSTPARTAIR